MALETGTYISDLVATNPTSTDPKSAGDDHLRLIKSTVKTTFPNVSGAVTPTHTELNYVDGVTSAIQTQMDLKSPLASPTFTGTVVLPATTSIGNASATEISYLDGVTSAIQTQLDLKAPLASPTLTGTPVAPTAAPGTNTTQIATTSFVATSFAPLASPTFTGTPLAPTATTGTNNTQLATTAFVTQTAFSAALPAQPGGTTTYQLNSTGGAASWGLVNPGGSIYLANNFGGF